MKGRFRIDGLLRLRFLAGLLALSLCLSVGSTQARRSFSNTRTTSAATDAADASTDPIDASNLPDGSPRTERTTIGGIHCAYWLPACAPGKRYPLIIFSHGFHGTQTQSTFLMKALASAGYIVVSPTHADALGKHMLRPPVPFARASQWNDQSAKYREQDVSAILNALPSDPRFANIANFDSIALAGHSLGGYTALALAGAWPTWKLPKIKAVLALSPFVSPFVASRTLGALNIPVMYQGGTRDFGITPTIARSGGAFDQTHGDVWFLNFDNFNHFSWTDLNLSRRQRESINAWSIWFLNRYVRGIYAAPPAAPVPLHHELYSTSAGIPAATPFSE